MTRTKTQSGCLTGLFGLLFRRQPAQPEFPYAMVESVLSKTELTFYKVLCQAALQRAIILSKVRMADIFNVTATDSRDAFAVRLGFCPAAHAPSSYGTLLFPPRCTTDAGGLGTEVFDSAILGVHRGPNERFFLAASGESFEPLVVDDVDVATKYSPDRRQLTVNRRILVKCGLSAGIFPFFFGVKVG